MHPKADTSTACPAAEPGHASAGTSGAASLVGAGSLAGTSIHFVGIGGSGMSGLAQMAHAMGAIVTGEDQEASELTDSLQRAGLTLGLGSPGSLPAACDAVVFSAAIPDRHPARAAAAVRGLRTRSYAEFLGDLQRQRFGVSISGTHGKSTTTSLLAHLLITAGLDPSVIIGATCAQVGGGSRTGSARIPCGPFAGQPGIMVAEACEYTHSFHRHAPRFALVNNIEADHLDFFKGLDDIIASFARFAQQLPAASAGGRLLIACQGAFRERVCRDVAARVSTFGVDDAADYRVSFIEREGAVTVHEGSLPLLRWRPSLPGAHNRLNAAAAGILATWLGAEREAVERGLESFAGVDRRMQRLGTVATADGGSAAVVDDYGHHPTECRLTLLALREHYKPRRLFCVFQPHQHSRTRFLMEDFARAFCVADRTLLPDIYFVRDSEVERQGVSARDLVDRIRALGGSAAYTAPFSRAVRTLQSELRNGDLVVTMGAGPVFKVARALLNGDPDAADA